MKLLTKTLRKKLPPLGATRQDLDPMVQGKFDIPYFDRTWYPMEYDGKNTFFGVIFTFSIFNPYV